MKLNKLTRYSVRFLLLLTASVAMSVGYVVNHNRQQLVAVQELKRAGVQIGISLTRGPLWSTWIKDRLYLRNGYGALIEPTVNLTPEVIANLRALDHLQVVYLCLGESVEQLLVKAEFLEESLAADTEVVDLASLGRF